MAAKKESIQHSQLMWLAILVMTLLMIPFLIGAIQQKAFRNGFAAGVEQVQK
jgi:hypothetical protein